MHWDEHQKRLGSSETLYGLQNIARFLGISRITLWRMLKTNPQLPIVKISNHRHFANKKLLRAYLDMAMISATGPRSGPPGSRALFRETN